MNRPTSDARCLEIARPPEGVVHIFLNVRGSLDQTERLLPNQAELLVSGAHATLHPIPLDVMEAIVAQLRPGAGHALLGDSSRTVTGRIAPLADIWGETARGLAARIVEQRTTAARVQAFTEVLTARVSRARQPDLSIVRAAELILSGLPRFDVQSLAGRLGYTPRHMLRKFQAELGLSPKEFARGMRLNGVLRNIPSRLGWAELATTHGYFDQAHLIRDFRELLGEPPERFAASVVAPELLGSGLIVRRSESATAPHADPAQPARYV